MKAFVKQAFGYAIASFAALGVDMSALFILVHYFFWDYLGAATVSFLMGAIVAYLLSIKLAFKQHRLSSRRTEFVSFVAIGTTGLALNAAVISVSVRYFGLDYIIAKCVAAGFTFACNFVARRQLLFVRPSVE